jgi:hypothetical protein
LLLSVRLEKFSIFWREHTGRLNFAKIRFALLFLSSIFPAVPFVVTCEIVKNIKYYRWKINFDSSRWLGKVTVPSQNPELMWEYKPNGQLKQVKMKRYGFRAFD